MILTLSARYSPANLPAVGQRVVYAPQGIKLKSTGVVTAHNHRRNEIHIDVRFDDGTEGTLLPTSLFREERNP